METELLEIYKSAIKSMKKEIIRLNLSIDLQKYQKKQEASQGQITELSTKISELQEYFDKQRLVQNTPRTRQEPSKSLDTSLITAKISELAQEVAQKKKEIACEQLFFEEKLRQVNDNLYILVRKYNEAKKTNRKLKTDLTNLTNERKNTNLEYARITKVLTKDSPITSLNEKISELECQNRKKIKKISEIKQKIEDLDSDRPEPDASVKEIVANYNEKSVYLKDLERVKLDLIEKIEEINQELDQKSINPQRFPSSVANKNLRIEIKRLELEISEKSKILKQVEREKLILQAKYLNVGKKIEKKRKPKSFSNCITFSSLPQGRTMSNFGGESDRLSKKSSININCLLKNTGKTTLTKEAVRLLDDYAPGQSITSKILAYNRAGFPTRFT